MKAKELPPGLEKLTESSQFWKNLKFQLETDSKEPEEVMVAYEAFLEIHHQFHWTNLL
jgi:hypothetical protein